MCAARKMKSKFRATRKHLLVLSRNSLIICNSKNRLEKFQSIYSYTFFVNFTYLLQRQE